MSRCLCGLELRNGICQGCGKQDSDCECNQEQ